MVDAYVQKITPMTSRLKTFGLTEQLKHSTRFVFLKDEM